MYDNPGYANERLGGTIVRDSNGKAVLCRECYSRDRTIVADVEYLLSGRGKMLPLDELNLEPVSLGFTRGVGDNIAYLSRMPMRRDYRQGLRSNNYRSVWGCDKRWISRRSLAETIENTYPTFEFALELSLEEGATTPFHREFALDGEGNILYKWLGIVGDVKNNLPQVHEKYSHLTEALEEATNGR